MGPFRNRRHLVTVTLTLLVLVALASLARPALRHVRAAALLLRFQDPAASNVVTRFAAHDVDERSVAIPMSSRAAVPARLYVPRGVESPAVLVLLHGVHHLGIQEPRLIRFSRAFAAAGVAVLTPEISELADYHVDPASLATIRASIDAAPALIGNPDARVGLMGLSFAGGLALIAAAQPPQPKLTAVVAVGAHDDLTRVLRFFATNEIERPDGAREHLKAHDYGPLVLVYSHAEDFFSSDDVSSASRALKLWLTDHNDEARALLPSMGAPARQLMEALFARDVGAISSALDRETGRLNGRASEVSPHGRLAGLHAPVSLLHGAGDSVIPATETLWLARDVPSDALRRVLVSPAVVHVELGAVSKWDYWQLVHFMAGVLKDVEASR